MTKFEIKGAQSNSQILIGENLSNVSKYLPSEKVVIITDTNVKDLYKEQFPNFPVIEIGMGEKIKTLETVEQIYCRLVDMEADRSFFILAIGGGLVCDVAGYVASTYMRGIRFGFVSSTLLSQVDASVGGKNGVNFKGYKNLIGTFNQPKFVICDINMLKTLPKRDFLCGFAEIIKHTCIADEAMFEFLEKNYKKALDFDLDTIEKLVLNSVEIKAGVVNKDEREKGERRKLNFGHTYGHAIEKVTGLPHGESVSLGMVAAARISANKNYITKSEAERIEKLLSSFGLPVEYKYDKVKAIEALGKDKKREKSNIKFVLLNKIGSAVIEDVPLTKVQKLV